MKRDTVRVQRPEDIAGAHQEEAETGVIGTGASFASRRVPVTGPAGTVIARLFRARALNLRGVLRVEGTRSPSTG